MNLRRWLLTAAWLALACLVAGCGEKKADMTLTCQLTSSRGLDCKIQNQGPNAGTVCFDAVVKCARLERVATICSSRLDAKRFETKSLAAFEPPIDMRETCFKAELRNKKVTAL